MGKWEQLTLPELYDLLAEETVKFNKQLLQKAARDEFKDLKETIKGIQEEIKRRTNSTPA
jgi:hypothetical protein